MRAVKKFTIGSMAFFAGMEGFSPRDHDELCIVDSFNLPGNVLRVPLHGKDIFFYRDMGKEAFINDALEGGVPMRVGKFLAPEFARYLGMTVDDLHLLEPLIRDIDEKHDYERDIYESYIANGDFYLTDEQRRRAYDKYQRRRTQ